MRIFTHTHTHTPSPHFSPTFPILRGSERVVYSAHTYALSGYINDHTNRPISAYPRPLPRPTRVCVPVLCLWWRFCPQEFLNEPMPLFSSTPSHTTVRSLARSWRIRRATAWDSLSLGSIFFVGESCTFLISPDAVFIGAVLKALRIKSCLSCVRNLAWSIAWPAAVCSAWMCRMNWPQFWLTRRAAALNKGTQERSVDYGALVREPTMQIHPVPVNIPTLAIVVTRGKGGDASSLVQLSKVCANKRHTMSLW